MVLFFESNFVNFFNVGGFLYLGKCIYIVESSIRLYVFGCWGRVVSVGRFVLYYVILLCELVCVRFFSLLVGFVVVMF